MRSTRKAIRVALHALRCRVDSWRDGPHLFAVIPGLRTFVADREAITASLRSDYELYTRTVSFAGYAASLELSVFLVFLVRAMQPARILDLGSGFTSFVLRRSLAQSGGGEVWSVDNDAKWLEKTRSYLAALGTETGRLMTWDDFGRVDRGTFDLVLYDLGNATTRVRLARRVLPLIAPGGIAVMDDVQKPVYGRYLRRMLADHRDEFTAFSARTYTLDQFGRHAIVVKRASHAGGNDARG